MVEKLIVGAGIKLHLQLQFSRIRQDSWHGTDGKHLTANRPAADSTVFLSLLHTNCIEM